MSSDPLRLLLRGCTRLPNTNTSNALRKPPPSTDSGLGPLPDTPATLSSANPLPPELDFFNSRSAPATPKTRAIRTPKPSPPPTTDTHSPSTLHALISHPPLRTALTTLQLTTATPVQRRAIPPLLAGHDVIAIAPTGSGKTLAYTLPLLQNLLTAPPSTPPPHALILSPTRELASQISRVVTRLLQTAKLPLRHVLLTTRGAGNTLRNAISNPDTIPNILIATPQTLVSTLKQTTVSLRNTRHIILDEADELLSPKFLPQVDTLLSSAGTRTSSSPPKIHLFSATLPAAADDLASPLLTNPHRVFISGGAYGGAAAVSNLSTTIAQRFTFVGGRGEQGKVMAVRALLREGLKPPILVFVQSRDRAAELFRELIFDGVQVDAIHGDRTAAARANAVDNFRTGKIWVLIATDLLARGLDFLCVNTVINYDMPSSATAYVHRIGRTGRNGRKGNAITLFTEEDRALVGAVAKVARASGAEVPSWLVNVGGDVRKDELKRLEKRPPKRKQVGGPNRASLKGGRKKRRRENSADDGDDGATSKGDVEKGDDVQNGVDGTVDGDGGNGRMETPMVSQRKKQSNRKQKKKAVKEHAENTDVVHA